MKRPCQCDCCAGVTASTPRPVTNRPGQPQVRYRTGTYADFRASMHAALTSAQRPALADLTTRVEEDLSIALLDGAACVADVLTFYTERLVNEAFLGTATDRLSLAELGKLVGYRLRPGVAAATYLAFHVEPPPAAPVAAATSPFRRIRMPEVVTVPAGLAVRSVPGPGEQQQVFETTAEVQARPQWNQMLPVTTKPTVLGSGATAVHVKGITTGLRPGDVLLFHGSADRWEIRPVATVTAQTEADRTLITWKSPLTKAAPLTPLAMRKRLSFFGHNAPRWESMSIDFKTDYGCAGCTAWPQYWSSPYSMTSDLDGSHPDVAVGSKLVFVADGESPALFTAASVAELSRAEFAVSGKVTRVELTGSSSKYPTFDGKVRETTIFAVEEELTPVGRPDSTLLVQGGQVIVAGDVTNLPPGRTVLVAGAGKAETATVKAVAATGANTTVTFDADLTHTYPAGTAVIFGNVVAATHGETVHQILGDGQAARPFQRFELKHAPLTYTPSDDPAGSASTLEVRVNDVAWHQRATLYQAAPADRVYVTRDNAAGAVEVRFGDGLHGARVPTGQHNVRAVYRKGTGAAGNLPAGSLTQLASPPLGVTGVTNPCAATGGADPDTERQARQGIPLSTRTLGRAVSLTDYADYARAFPGIAKAHALVLPLRHVRTIVVTVAGEDGAPVPDQVRARLTSSLRGYGDPLVPVVVVAHRPVPFQVRMKLRCHPDHDPQVVRAAVAAALRHAFGFAARQFAQPVHRSEVIAAAHRAPGLLAVDLDQLFRGSVVANQARLAAAGPQLSPSTVDGAELLLITADPTAWLTELP